MAGPVMFKRAWLLPLLSVLLVGSAAAAPAEALSDPTRPANFSGGGDGVPGAVDSGASNELQSTLLVPGRKPRALIAGQWLEQGQLYGNSRVVKITAGSVILQAVEGGKAAPKQVLSLTPGIEKTKPAALGPKRAVEIK